MTLRKRWWSRAVLVVLGLLVVGYGVLRIVLRPGHVDCPPSGKAMILVSTAQHTLALCEGGRPAATFHVRIGKAGTGKSREGDEKTPLGRYALGVPRPSRSFGTFVSIAYPTLTQQRAGFTGGSVGVHGPDRRVRWLGALVNALDTTDGCVGIATDADMASISKWVGDRRPKEIVLE